MSLREQLIEKLAKGFYDGQWGRQTGLYVEWELLAEDRKAEYRHSGRYALDLVIEGIDESKNREYQLVDDLRGAS